ncbi:MAG TPA: VTT domain-containing protein [Acidobacteriaceae bacterium]|nr:VTT domain-containing protein [Acidobacteriaceae bacterium]
MHWLISLGWVGLFSVSLIDACPFPLPIPGTTDLLLLLLVVRKGRLWVLVPLAVGGAVVGAFTTWSAGKKGGEKALRRYVPERYYERITNWMKKYGATAVALAAISPPPVALMPFLAAAGVLGVTRGRFLAAFTTARMARYALVAWLGVRYGHHMVHWWNQYLARYSGTIGSAILVLFIAAFAWGFWQWRRSGARHAAQPAHS